MLTHTAITADLAACMKHLSDVIEYAERYAELAGEPAEGSCRRSVRQANEFMDRRLPMRPAPAPAPASALIGQPDKRCWRVHGVIFSTAEMLIANAHSPAVIAWVHSARAGDRFHGGVAEAVCLG